MYFKSPEPIFYSFYNVIAPYILVLILNSTLLQISNRF